MGKINNGNNDVSSSIPEELKNNISGANNIPSSILEEFSDIQNLALLTEVFKKIEEETVEVAEMLFEFLLNASDSEIMTGTIPLLTNKAKINKYIKILNRLFKFSRGGAASGGYRVINRKMIAELDKKTFAISMVHDGGVSLDILCDVVNVENNSRTPTKSPVRVTVRQAFTNSKNQER